MRRDAASQAQVNAAQPDMSTWLGANAGSGKTRVLTDRVARLLLGGVPPERILCLTYTKAAASEMQNRLFKRLGEWAMKPDEDLQHVLIELGLERTLTAQDLANARSLFAQAIEAPGGLKIQTIHAFCAAILRRFPLEAGISSQFSEMEDRAGQLLRARIVQEMADGPEAGLVANLARRLSDGDFEPITTAISGVRPRFEPGRSPADLRALLDLPDAHGPAWVWGDVFEPEDRALLRHFAEILRTQSPTMVTLGQEIETQGLDRDDAELGEFLAKKLLTQALTPHRTRPTKGTRDAMGDAWSDMEALIDRLSTAAQRPNLVALYDATCDLHAFAAAFLPRYAAAKAARGWLDFDDLILKTRDLLSDERVASWVLYRLDGGIDHILVDEAQDTSPVQWEVIEKLAQEFTSGTGARSDVARTIFVVGDKKQSIYSFQGADPSGFDRMRNRFEEKLAVLQAPFQDASLEYSFRSSEAILKLVDLTFQDREQAGFARGAHHHAFHGDMPGRVDLWPVEPKPEKPAQRHWTSVVDLPDSEGCNVVLARKIAAEIKRVLAEESLPHLDRQTGQWTGRQVEPRDILILVQRRSELFADIIRACKQAELPIAGADRLKVGAELAVRDLAALLSWLALPEDDLSLATALRSPLLGWDEQALFTLCHGRTEPYLWRTLEARQEQHAETWAMLRDLRDASDYARPYDLIERILIRHDGRARLLSRLGNEAEDGINALLDQALGYESAETPSLTGFLLWMETDALEIKRQPDLASNQIRVMTVHGAKGLEAPIVILPDCAQRSQKLKGPLLDTGDAMVMKPRSDAFPSVLQAARDRALARQVQERDRLLYVAMTRAESWLIVAAAGELGKDGEAWHDRARTALEHANAMPWDFEGIGAGLRYQSGDWPERPQLAPTSDHGPPVTVPDWLRRAAPVRMPRLAPLSPSRLGGAKALPGEGGRSEDAALAHGTAVHLWLENLGHKGYPPDPSDVACQEAQRVVTHPDLAFLFTREALPEVSFTVPLPGGGRMHGTIDVLVVQEGVIWAVDYKTNAVLPDTPEAVPEGLLRQMGAYATALSRIYPDHEIRTALLWTRGPRLMVLPHESVTAAFHEATSP